MKLFQSFFLGIFGSLGALFLEIIFLAILTPLSSDAQTFAKEFNSISLFFFLAIFAEEFSKYVLLYKFSDKNNNIVLNSLFFGLGFSILEVFLVYWNYRSGLDFDPIGLFGIAIVHISTATIIGYSARKNSISFMPSLFCGLIPAFLIHLGYNLLKISEIQHQKEITIALLALFIFADFSLLLKSKMSNITEEI